MITDINTLDGFTFGDNLIKFQLICMSVQVDHMPSAFVSSVKLFKITKSIWYQIR